MNNTLFRLETYSIATSLFSVFHSTISPQNFCYAVTGASRGYAFVEFETEKEMRRAYKVIYVGKY